MHVTGKSIALLAVATRLPGTTVKLIGTITPPADDSNASDNTISIGVAVPATLPTSSTPVNIPCVG